MKELFMAEGERKSAVDIVVDRIKNLLIEKKLKPGDLIPSEVVLSESLQVSRGSIREAMKILSAYGVVEVRRGAGTYIAASANHKNFDPLLFRILVSEPDDRELVEIRHMMEKGIVRMILENATEEDYLRLDEAMNRFDDIEEKVPVDRQKGDTADIAYHRIMGEITHNKILSNIYNFVIDLFTPTINSSVGYHTHREMHQAIMDRDLERAMNMVDVHTVVWKSSAHENEA